MNEKWQCLCLIEHYAEELARKAARRGNIGVWLEKLKGWCKTTAWLTMAMCGDNMGGETHSLQDELKHPGCIAGKHCPTIFLHARNAVASTSSARKKNPQRFVCFFGDVKLRQFGFNQRYHTIGNMLWSSQLFF